jgi:Holliday junction resolvasome RuvABC endonuclease subunit
MLPIILGIDPGTRYMGIAVIRGQRLLVHGVHTLRNGEHPYDLIGHARRIVLGYVERYTPEIVAIEKPLLLPTKRAALVSAIVQELAERGKELSLRVPELSPEEVRQAVVGDPRATKFQVAAALVEKLGFSELKGMLPVPPARTALGWRPKDKYWLHMFDALGVAVTAQKRRPNVPGVRIRDQGVPIGTP